MKRFITAITASGVLVAGAATATIVGPAALAGAQESTATSQEAAQQDGERHRPRPCDPDAEPGPGAQVGGRILGQALSNLVEDGTLDDAQATAVKDEVVEVATEARRQFCEDHAGDAIKARIQQWMKGGVEVAAEIIGIPTEALVNQVRNAGKTIAEVGEQHGVSQDELEAALLADALEALDASDLPDEVKEQLEQRLPQLIERFVTSSPGDHPRGDGDRPQRPGDRPQQPADASEPADAA